MTQQWNSSCNTIVWKKTFHVPDIWNSTLLDCNTYYCLFEIILLHNSYIYYCLIKNQWCLYHKNVGSATTRGKKKSIIEGWKHDVLFWLNICACRSESYNLSYSVYQLHAVIFKLWSRNMIHPVPLLKIFCILEWIYLARVITSKRKDVTILICFGATRTKNC